MSGNSVLDKDQSAEESIRPEFLPDGSHDDLGMSDDERQAETGNLNDLYRSEVDGSDLKSAEGSPGIGTSKTSGDSKEQSALDSLYNSSEKSNQNSFKNFFGERSNKRKSIAAIAGVGMVGSIIAMFGMFSSLNLDMFFKNIEAKSFVRFQVDMEGRSSKWINAYITLRLMEVDDSGLTPEDRDNVIFRSNRVDTNSPTTDWYRTLRASKFEQEVFEKHGIKFTSAAYRDGNGRMQFRPAIVSINDEQIKFNLTEAEQNAIGDAVDNNNLDVNKFNGRLSAFVDVQVLDSDKEGRKAIKKIVNENTKSWQFVKRYYTRKAIQNMTGVRDWRFFEKTQEKWHDKKVAARTKLIQKAMPESTRSGKFIQCLFAILPSSECKSSTDPNDPANHSEPEGDSDDVSNDDSKSKGFTSKILNNVVTKFASAAGALDTINTLTKIDEQVKNGTLSKGVYSMRNAQAIGAFTTLGIAASQAHTGELTAEEYNEFMQIFSYAGTSEGWNKVITNTASSNTVSAEGFTDAKDKEEYCSDVHQEALKLPENKKAAEQEYHYLCDAQKIGASTNAQTFESAWQNSVGYVLGPLGSALDSTGAGWLLDKFNSVLGSITGPIVNGALKGLGLSDNIEDIVGWAVGKVARFAGAVPLIDESSPGGVVLNHMIQGGAGAAEASSRLAGGALATETSVRDSEVRVAKYMHEKDQSMSTYDRYLSLDNTESVLASAITTNATHSRSNIVTRTLSVLWKAPSTLTSNRKAKAATPTGREAANFGDVKMYDIPSACTDTNPLDSLEKDSLPKMTNADELGLISSSDLTWDLMTDSAEFYGKLYSENPDESDKIETVYNCAVFDSMARGATAGRHAPELAGTNAIEDSSSGQSSVSSGVGGTFTVATYNLPSKSGYGPTQWSKAVNLIKTAKVPKGGQGMDIIGFQELRHGDSNFNYLKNNLPNYDSWPKKANNPCAVPQAVFWNTKKFDFVKGDFMSHPRYNNLDTDCGPDGGGKIMHGHAQVPIVWLSTKAGQQVIFMNTHGAANGFGNNADGKAGALDQSSERRMLSADLYIQKIEQLKKENPGVPIVFTGDFNEGTGVRVKGNITYEYKQSHLFFCKVTAKNLMKNAESPEKDCRQKNGIGGVDYIYLTPEIIIDRFKPIYGGKSISGSDHPKTPIYTTITIPGSPGNEGGGNSEVGPGGFAWPVDKKYWDNNKSDFLDQHTTISGTFTSPYAKGVAVDISSPPKGAAVYSMLAGTVEKTNLCGSGDGMIVRSTVGGNTVFIAYGHAIDPKLKKGDKVTAGQRILSLDGKGCKTTGPHLHIDMTFNGKHVCPQDVFRAMGDNKNVNLLDLSKKSRSPCN